MKKLLESRDPAMNAAIAVLLITAGALAFVGLVLLAIPALIGAGLWKWYMWYQAQPVPTEQLIAQNKVAIPEREEVVRDLFRQYRPEYRGLPDPLFDTMIEAAVDLYDDEDLGAIDKPPPPQGTLEEARYRDAALARLKKVGNIARVNQLFQDTLNGAYISFMDTLPPFSDNTESGYSIRLMDAVKDPQRSLSALITPFFNEEVKEFALFKNLKAQLEKNANRSGKFVPPSEFKGPPHELLTYLEHTHLYPIFQELLNARLPFEIPIASFSEHGFLFAKSGHGKSQSMRAIVSDLINKDCALFILDGNGALIENLDRIDSIRDRLVVLDPTETPALNFFKLQGSSREKQMELFFYLFKAIDQGLTERQATMVAYLVELMLVVPNATLDTLRYVCEGKFPYQQYLPQLPQITQDFFTTFFNSNDQLVKGTKSQLVARLLTVGRNHMFASMFSSPENKFDAFKCMQEKKIVIVNTSRNDLGDLGSAIFGRYILAQCLAAAFQRPKNARHLALVVVDEAKAYLDDQSKKILSDARAFGVGMLLASQFPDQLDDGVRKEVINNTSVKFAGPAAYSIVMQLCRDMRCEPDFILNMKKVDYSHADWACYIDNVTPKAVKLTVPFGTIEKLPQMDAETYAAFRERNRVEVCHAQSPPNETLRVSVNQPPEADVPAVPLPPAALATSATKRPPPEHPRTPTNPPTRDPHTDYDTDH